MYIKHKVSCLNTFLNADKRVENTTRSGVFFTNFEVIRIVVNLCFECFIFSIKTKTTKKWRNKVVKIYVTGSDMRQAPHCVIISFLQTRLINDEFEKYNIIMNCFIVCEKSIVLRR